MYKSTCKILTEMPMIIKWKVYFWFYRSAKRKFYGRVQNLLFGYIDIENIKGAIYEHFFSV